MNNTPTTFSKLLNGISNTLTIVNKAVPIYKESKPILNTISKTYKTIKNNKTNLNDIVKIMKLKKIINKDNIINKIDSTTKIKKINTNNPTFFI